MLKNISINRNQKIILYVGIALLIYAMMVAVSGPSRDSNLYWSIFPWFLHYGDGYIHRAFMGSLVRLLFGEVEFEVMKKMLTPVERTITVVEIMLLWALLVPRIAWAKTISINTRWLFMAISAVVLLSPVWKSFVFLIGFMDKWMYLAVLLAMAAFILRLPVLYVIFILSSLLIHRGAIFFCATLALIILHAVLRVPVFQKRWRTWCLAAAIPFIIYFILSLVHDNNILWNILKDAPNYRILKRFGGHMGIGVATTLTNGMSINAYIVNRMWVFPLSTLLTFLIFAGPPLLMAFLFCRSSRRVNLNFDYAPAPRYRPAFLIKRIEFILPMVAAMMPLPLNFFAIDLARLHYWCWLSFALALIYYVWYARNAENPKTLLSESKQIRALEQQTAKNTHSLKITIISIAFIAFLFAGTPVIIAWRTHPIYAHCHQWCTVSEHALGRFFAQTIYKTIADAPLSFRYTASEWRGLIFPNPYQNPSFHGNITERNGHVFVGPEYQGRIYSQFFIFDQDTKFLLELRHEEPEGKKRTPQFELWLNYQKLSPTKVESNRIQWKYTVASNITGKKEYLFAIDFLGSAGFEFISLSMDARPVKIWTPFP